MGVLNAVLMAVRRRRPRDTLIHSDQGTRYGSDAWRQFCRSNHLEPSMSRKGNCWDNAVAESFFSSLKKERIKKQIYKNRELAIAEPRRLYRYLLQSDAPSQPSRRAKPRAIRSGPQDAPAASPRNPGNSTIESPRPGAVPTYFAPVDVDTPGRQSLPGCRLCSSYRLPYVTMAADRSSAKRMWRNDR